MQADPNTLTDDEEVWRPLRCTGCLRTILVLEVPPGWIDPARYVGGVCGCLAAGELEDDDPQLSLLDEPTGLLSEQPRYDPMMAAIPF